MSYEIYKSYFDESIFTCIYVDKPTITYIKDFSNSVGDTDTSL